MRFTFLSVGGVCALLVRHLLTTISPRSRKVLALVSASAESKRRNEDKIHTRASLHQFLVTSCSLEECTLGIGGQASGGGNGME